MSRREKEPPPVYECKPPSWLPKVHNSADLGYVGFFPPRPDQEEEVLTENNVKNGLHQTPFVPLETYSAQEPIRTRLVAENALSELEDLMNQILVRKTEDLPSVAPSTFRLPSRVTLNDGKRQAWFADLANPDVPLQKLGKSVPHGAKGHELLDLLHEHNVAVPRAVWFLRVFGGNETVGLRNKPHYNPTQYSVDWANLVTGYLRKQLTLVALPMAPRHGLNVKQTFKGVLAESDSRARWLSKFTYSLSLLRAFYAEGLVDNRTLLLWIVQQVATCNLAQLGFVARMVDEYVGGMLVCHALARPLVEFTLRRLCEIRTSPGNEHLASVVYLLHNAILRVLLALPDAFVNPRIWAQHSVLIEEILSEYRDRKPSLNNAEQNSQALDQTLENILTDLRQRNDAMLFRVLPPRVVGHLSSALADIKFLNSLSGRSDLSTVAFFDRSPDRLASFPDKLDILLTWSVTPLQHGDHRPYAAVSLLRFWCFQEEERAIRRGRESPHDFLQDQLFDWLDSSEVAADSANLHSVALVFGQLVKQCLFSYPHYIQRLIARGERGLDQSEGAESRHRSFLRWIPLYESSSSLIAQRKVTLYGARVRETPEDCNEREIRKRIRGLLPELFGAVHAPLDLSSDFCENCSDLFSATRFEQVRLMNGWLLPLLKKWIAAQSPSAIFDASDPSLQVYCIATTLLARCRSYGTMLDLTLFTLEHATSNELLTAVLRTLRQHVEVWACMDKMQPITTALYDAHVVWKSRGVRSRPLMNLLIELDSDRLLGQAARDQVRSDYSAFSYALRPLSEQPQAIPETLPEILLLATDNNPDAPIALANSLWYNYRSTPNWDWLVWDNTVASLQQLPHMIEDEATRKACTYKYATFLTHVDQHLPNGFDEQILSWFQGPGRAELESFSSEMWDELSIIFFYLSIHGALATTTILSGLIYPIWSSASVSSSPEHGQSLELQLNAANRIFDHLLLQETCVDGIPPSDFFELQGLQTRRRDAFRHPHFVALAENIPTLVLIEHNVNLPPHLRDGCRQLRETLCGKSVFRLGIYRDLETVHRAFEAVLGNRDVAEELHEPLIYALKVMFSEDHTSDSSCVEQWQILSTSLTPWKLAATSIELRFTIKQLEEALARDGSRDKARQALNRITTSLFKQGMCSEEVDFVTGIVKGASVEIVVRFVNAGLQRITEILKAQSRPRPLSDYGAMVGKIGEVLRFVTSLADACREEVAPGPAMQMDTLVHDELIAEIKQEVSVIEHVLNAARDGTSKHDGVQEISSAVVLLARIIQFTLGLPALWSSKSRMESETLCASIFNLALLYGSGITLDTVIFPLLIDTLYYLLDEIPSDPKATSYNPFRYYPNLEWQQVPPDMPATYRSTIRTLLPFVHLNNSVVDLVYLSKDGDAATTPVPNRPWEWMEHLGDRSGFEANGEVTLDGAIKNVTSLSLELFDTRAIGKSSTGNMAADASDTDPDHRKTRNTLSTLEETSATESIFRRDWRESRIFALSPTQDLSHIEQGMEDEPGPLPSLTATDRRSNSSRMASPVSSVRSRGSVQPSTLLHMSPSQLQQQLLPSSGSTASDAIDVDSLNLDVSNVHPSTSQILPGNKRKATDNDGDVTEVSQGASTSQKRAKAKAQTTKPKPKKR